MPVNSVLVADDDAGIRDLIRTRLHIAGYDVHTCRNGLEALERVRSFPPTAMVLDINMPALDGFGVLRELQQSPRTARLPVLMLTARHAEQDVRTALALGARDYLTKPFSEAQLLARVSRMMRAPFGPTGRSPYVTSRPSG